MKSPLIRLPYISDAPLQVMINRNKVAESVHEVDIALCDADGSIILGMGDYEAEIFPRSAMKPLQAIALIEWLASADNQPELSPAEMALICASHNGEPAHSEAVIRLLEKFELAPDALICGAHWSLDQESLIEQVRALDAPDKTHNNCSGKHTGMLVLAKLMTGSGKDYAEITHAAQQRILGVLEFMTGADLLANVTAIDGCGAPVYRAPLGNWARAFALFAGGGEMQASRRLACEKLRYSIAANPYLIAGKNRACSAINAAYGEAITVKVGAEGVYSAAFHDLNLGLMLKARDGSRRAAEIALGAVIKSLGYEIDESLKQYLSPDLRNWAGVKVGDVSLGNFPISI